MKIKKQYLLLLASIVWTLAGVNILKIGIEAYAAYLGLLNFLLTAAVFSLFLVFVFLKLVRKHTGRILSYEAERQLFIKFFDVKSFIIMAVMMSGGILLRSSGIAPIRFIAVFYTGLGGALLLSGILFGKNFLSALRKAER